MGRWQEKSEGRRLKNIDLENTQMREKCGENAENAENV